MAFIQLRGSARPRYHAAIIAFAAVLLIAAVCIMLTPSQARAETKTVTGNYAVLDGTTITFKYTATSTLVAADAVYTGYDTEVYEPGPEGPLTPWRKSKENITKVVFDSSTKGNLKPVSTAWWFVGMTKLGDVENLSNLDLSQVTKAESMFMSCSSLKSLDVSSFDTSNVTDMSGMFAGCSSLISLDVSRFNTSNVTDMSGLFSGCSYLSSLDVSGFDTSQATDMGTMFQDCALLTSIDVSGFRTSNATRMEGMFRYCSSLLTLDVSRFGTSSVTRMDGMFKECSSLGFLDVSRFNTSKVTRISGMFDGCSSLTTLDVSSFDVSQVQKDYSGNLNTASMNDGEEEPLMATSDMPRGLSDMFKGCVSLKTIYSNSDWSTTTGAENASDVFLDCTSLVGGNGTVYNASHVNAEYARLDAEGTPGYFTKNAAMHRLYNPNSGEHFYTSDDKERDHLIEVGWNNEGEGWNAPDTSNTPVYRVYNSIGGEHHYTMDASERDNLVRLGWNDEGIGWYSDDAKTVPLYRDYNPNAFANNHNYTTDKKEHENLISLGWQDEGFAWYGV